MMRTKQRDLSDCGAACLTSIASFYKLHLPVAKIRQFAGTNRSGTSVLGLLEAAKKIGFDAKGVKGDIESIFKVPKPVIAHVVIKNILHHFVVIYAINKEYIEIMDPADGLMHKKSHDEFKAIWSGIMIILLPSDEFEMGKFTTSAKLRFWNLLVPHKMILIQVLIGSLVYTILGLSTSIFIQKIFDNVIVNNNRNLLNLMVVGMFFILFFQIIIGVTRSIFTLRTGQMIDGKLILSYYKHLMKLPQQFFDTMRVGEIISRINDAVKIRTFINEVFINLMVNVFIVIFSFALMFTYYWKLALVTLAVIPLYLSIYLISNKLNKRVQRQIMERSADLESQLVESLNAVNTIKSFSLEEFSNTITETKFVFLLKSIYKSGLNSLFNTTSTDAISKISTICILWIGTTYVLSSEISPGELLSFYTLIGYFTGPITSLVGMNKVIQDANIASDRLFEIMDLDMEDKESNRIELSVIGDIRFENVRFGYSGKRQLFENLNLLIPAGKTTAIIGESGSGKSTISALIHKLYPLQEGNIYFGNQNIKYIDNHSLRKFIGIVPQKVILFNGNIIDNICIGQYEPDLEKVINICTKLGIMPFIEELPNGLTTYIGENGTTLSGGQKQLLAIARVLYNDPEVIIFDEATSSLDSMSEKKVQSAISELKIRNKTIMIIAHRLSSILIADKIIVVEKGKVIEQGEHDELYKNKSQYFNLWQHQIIPDHF
ncbi:peptidase domain-containing ABC transporter [Pedobacter sp. AW31-3R]|uniref:peptidase domain-containing ABC transporter n=1 Tax=Pedobacter sp. AW31-3R TaxID=3445781 RepID=UPI003FA06C50